MIKQLVILLDKKSSKKTRVKKHVTIFRHLLKQNKGKRSKHLILSVCMKTINKLCTLIEITVFGHIVNTFNAFCARFSNKPYKIIPTSPCLQ